MTHFISDIGSNHNGSLERARQLIKASKDIGCWGTKLQYFKADLLWTKKKTIAKMKKWELPGEWIPELSDYAHSLGLKFGITPFFLDAVNEIEPYVDFYKIGSYEAKWKRLIMACAITEKPLIISAGLITNDEITEILRYLPMEKVAILHCNSNYPAKVKECNLERLNEITEIFVVHDGPKKVIQGTGWSDHTKSPAVIYNALAYEPDIIEFHLDLDGKGNEYEHGHCWLPNGIKTIIYVARQMELSDKCNKSLPPFKLIKLMTDPKTGRRPY